MPEFLDLAHRHVLLVTDPAEHDKLNRELIGPPRITRPSTVDPHAGFTPPSWWRGDARAARGAIAAMTELKHRK